MNNENAASQIGALLTAQTKAIQKKNIVEATNNYASDVVIYDVVGPLGHPKGVGSVKERLQNWFSTFEEQATITFELVDLSISAGEDLAFSHSFNHVTAVLKKGGSLDMYWR